MSSEGCRIEGKRHSERREHLVKIKVGKGQGHVEIEGKSISDKE